MRPSCVNEIVGVFWGKIISIFFHLPQDIFVLEAGFFHQIVTHTCFGWILLEIIAKIVYHVVINCFIYNPLRQCM
jgi:hypothetical protein